MARAQAKHALKIAPSAAITLEIARGLCMCGGVQMDRSLVDEEVVAGGPQADWAVSFSLFFPLSPSVPVLILIKR